MPTPGPAMTVEPDSPRACATNVRPIHQFHRLSVRGRSARRPAAPIPFTVVLTLLNSLPAPSIAFPPIPSHGSRDWDA